MRLCRFVIFVIVILFSSRIIAQLPSSPATSTSEHLSADMPRTTVLGNAFVAPKDWSMRVSGPSTILEAPEGDSWIALIDVQANTAEEALAAAWKAYKPDAKWPVRVSNDLPDRDGWTRRRIYQYLTSPNEKRAVAALFPTRERIGPLPSKTWRRPSPKSVGDRSRWFSDACFRRVQKSK
jgi:hypothetical protein